MSANRSFIELVCPNFVISAPSAWIACRDGARLARAHLRGLGRDPRHAPLAHPGAREARCRARTTRAQLQHAALRLTARGLETRPLPAPDGSGAFVAALDLHVHEAAIEHSD